MFENGVAHQGDPVHIGLNNGNGARWATTHTNTLPNSTARLLYSNCTL